MDAAAGDTDRAWRISACGGAERMVKRRALLMLGAGAALAPTWLRAQRAATPRIGYLLFAPANEVPSRERQAFLDGLRDFGLVPGKNVEMIYRSAEGEVDFMDDVAQDLLRQHPDVLAVSGALAVLAAKRATRTVPIVMLGLGDPVGIGAVASLARPGANVTGIAFLSSELAPKRLQFAKSCVPGARRMAVIWDSRNPNSREESRAVQQPAAKLGLSVESFGLASTDALARTFARLASVKPDLLYVTFEGGLASANRTAIAEFGVKHRIPVVSGWSFLTEAGGLLSYGADMLGMFRRGAYYVDRVLKGAVPAEMPIELPTKVELTINQRTANAIGVTIPPDLLLRADNVIS